LKDLTNIKNKELTIILINYKSHDLLRECLNSLKRQTYKNFNVFIVDNTPGNYEYYKLEKYKKKFKQFFEIYLFKPKLNLGFAGGNNLAIKNSNSYFILLLNCDTELESNTLEKCISFLKENSDVGMLSPKILYFKKKNLIWYAGAYLNPRSIYFSYHIGLNQKNDDKYNVITETSYACGAALFTKREIIEKIGLMDEIFFMYVEETDWNYRVKKAGYKIIYFPEAVIYHKVDVINKYNRLGFRDNPFQIYLYNRNKIIFTMKHFSLIDIISFFLKFQFRTNFFEIFWAIINNKSNFFLAQIRSTIMGLTIGIRRRPNRNCRKLLKAEMNYLNKFIKSLQVLEKKVIIYYKRI